MPQLNRNALIAGGVVLLHVGVLWALQHGLLRRAAEVVVPVQILSELLTPAPEPEPPQPVAEPRPLPPRAPAPRPVRKAEPTPAKPPRPQPAARVDPAPSPLPPAAPAATPAQAPVAAAAAPVLPAAPVAAPAPAPAPARVDLPSSDADYLQNPRPVYPPMSKRMGEQGKVIVRVLIGADGAAQKAEIRQSSGYDRLDQAALETVMRWRYVPGKRAGVAETMWFNVPINFVLE